MDPRSKLAQTILPFSSVLEFIENSAKAGKNFGTLEAAEFRQIVIRDLDPMTQSISYGKLCQLIEETRTPKMFGGANKGLGFVKEQAKLYAKKIING